MTTILVTGYKNFDLGIFQDKDPKITIIKKAIKRDFIHFLEEGVDWFVFMGNLGFEYWALEVALSLQTEYDMQLATIFPFENHGEHWSEANQEKLFKFKQTDFVKSSYKRYQNSYQFKKYNQFLLDNTDRAYLFYDKDKETNLKYLYQMMTAKDNYPVSLLTFEDLDDIVQDFD
ncbi:DUF1273 domain-containing protein [Streptococcus mutans]|uniref:DUF1273 domain-containing protein n=1 Tax=Streptococcus mutans TaxID=1309 RepID=UPI0002B5045C|nr:DUF1273 domain-containing protein [Streptococcus mutans]EMB81041.1 hypothetical protein SMU44_01521 [Streptococcus mutans 11VS1]EMC02184.1 hypothetical protein SMU66_01559 [Streptococcus mutans N34]MBT3147993.1 DUF1273 domain-containing protein [Streptococcus mutans]MBW3479881.1 DUF1273 domain-containing protein [Streptococcus mutans]MCB4948675.1 DUF1273 domain-containing protein [Streptococcus mutans]